MLPASYTLSPSRQLKTRALTMLEMAITVLVFAVLISVIFSFLSSGTDSLKTVALTMDVRRRANEALKQVSKSIEESRRDFLIVDSVPDQEQAQNRRGKKAFQCIVCASPRDDQNRYTIEGHVSQFQGAVIYFTRPRLENGETVYDLVRVRMPTDPNSWSSETKIEKFDPINPNNPPSTAVIRLSNGLEFSRYQGTVLLSNLRYLQISDPSQLGPLVLELGVHDKQGRVESQEDFQTSVSPGQ